MDFVLADELVEHSARSSSECASLCLSNTDYRCSEFTYSKSSYTCSMKFGHWQHARHDYSAIHSNSCARKRNYQSGDSVTFHCN